MVLAPRAATAAAARAMRWSLRVMVAEVPCDERGRVSVASMVPAPARPDGLTWVSTFHTCLTSVQRARRAPFKPAAPDADSRGQ